MCTDDHSCDILPYLAQPYQGRLLNKSYFPNGIHNNDPTHRNPPRDRLPQTGGPLHTVNLCSQWQYFIKHKITILSNEVVRYIYIFASDKNKENWSYTDWISRRIVANVKSDQPSEKSIIGLFLMEMDKL